MLAELVKAGKLPPVEQRVPDEPLVIKPLHEIGKYGGTWRRAFTGPADNENGNRIMSTRQADVLGLHRHEAHAVRREGAGRSATAGETITFSLRKGHKWSDGHAVHRRRHHVLVRGPVPEQGSDADADRRDVDQRQAGHDREGRRPDGPASCSRSRIPVLHGHHRRRAPTSGRRRATAAGPRCRGPIAPEHYLKQFLPKYAGQEKVDAAAKAAGFDNWVDLLHQFKADWRLQRRAAGPDALEDDLADQHAELGRWSGTRTTTPSTPRGISFRTSTRSR